MLQLGPVIKGEPAGALSRPGVPRVPQARQTAQAATSAREPGKLILSCGIGHVDALVAY